MTTSRIRNVSRPRRVALYGAMMATIGVSVVAARGEAVACGGLFCNRPPPDPFAPLPVAQNGENVVFAITKDPAGGAPTIEAHIQILYTGDAAKFSWVVPVEAVPVLSTGTDLLFSRLASLTQPTFIPSYQTSGTCLPDPQFNFGTGTGGAFDAAAGTTGAAGSGGINGPTVQIAFQGAVGPFDAAVVKSDDPTALKTWLTTNGYTVTDAAGALIDVYVRENKYFVALKLLNGVGVSAIQPIVLTFRGTEACVPLRLTAIAANPDMPVLVWVLSDKRAVPRGFYEMEIDEARIDWWNNGSTYFGPKGLVGQAADEAGGNAFITEYAGSSTIARGQVDTKMINLTQLMASMTPPVYVQQLINMGIASDPIMLGLLAQFIPMPDAVKAMNVTPSQFYGNISFYWSQYAFPPFDLAGLTDAISTSIAMPRTHAQAMIDAHPYLTRLNTFLSPSEMNQDAFFFESQNLPDVSNVHTATIWTMCGKSNYMACNAPRRLQLSDGRMMWLSAGSKLSSCQSLPLTNGALASLPAASVAWKRDDSGPGMAVVDNGAKIMAGIDAYNKTFPSEQQLFPIPAGTGTGGAAGSSVSGAAGVGGAAGAGGASGAAGVGLHLNGGGDGCSCSVANEGGGALTFFACAGALGLLLKTRRRRD